MNQVRAPERFFVYGSMSTGLVHFQKIREFVQNCRPAQICGTAYRLKVGFPVVVEGGEDSVSGELVDLNGSELLVQLLDGFHGVNHLDPSKSLYFRRQVQVRGPSGELELAWVYFFNPKFLPKNAALIQGGNWKESLDKEPTLLEKLSEKQKQYIRRLGAVSGREIIPIDLQLYRELMNLEMIVDKGRRLALSKLGHEVCRYLT